MKNRSPLLAAAAFLIVATAVPASALDLGIGGNGGASVSAGSGSNGGTRVGVRAGRTSVGVTLGGGSNIASTSVGTGRNTVNAKVGTNSGPLVGLSSSNRDTTGTVNLGLGGGLNGPLNDATDTVGGILDGVNPSLPGLPGGPAGPGGGAITPGSVAGAIGGMGGGQMAALKLQCDEILDNPRRFDRELVSLCMILLRL